MQTTIKKLLLPALAITTVLMIWHLVLPNQSVPIALAADGPRILGQVPEFTLHDQAGSSYGTKQLSGRIWIANFIFTRCPLTCPIQSANLAKLQNELQSEPGQKQVRLISISVDPEYDSPKILRRYAKKYQADNQRWRFLTGAKDDIWQLSKDGFKMPVSEATDNTIMPIAHSSQFALIDQQGRIRGYYDGLKADGMAAMKADLKQVLTESTSIQPIDDRLVKQVPVPELPWMTSRAEEQQAAIADLDLFLDFGFTDRFVDSGITFRHKIVDDAGRRYKLVHYDHGNGVVIADVDGDGRLDIYFVSQAGSNELWRNRGNGQFEDITNAAGVGLEDRLSVTASFADIDNDGDPDLYVTTVRFGNALFENDGTGKFKDISESSGLNYVGHSSSAVFFDFNRDGLLDLFLTNVGQYTIDEKAELIGYSPEQDQCDYDYYLGIKDAFAGHLKPERAERSILFENRGQNRFADVSEQTQLVDESWSGDATPLDANDDGWPDLYVLSMQGHDQYYENISGERFIKRSRDVFPKTPWGAMGVKVFDFDNDGNMDVYVTDMHSDMTETVDWDKEKLKAQELYPESFTRSAGRSIFGNALFRSLGNGEFEEISDQVGAENFWPWGLSVGDLNADGYVDAFVASSMNYPFRYGVNSVLMNHRGQRFVDSEFVLGVEPRRGGRAAQPWFEIDCSTEGRDLYECKGRQGWHLFWGALGSRSSVIFDADDDGDLDIITGEFNDVPMVLISDLSDRKPISFLKIRLIGTESNRDGLGARVVVRTNANTYTKVHDGQSGYMSQSSHPLYFGLADAGSVDQIHVRWPSGKEQTIDGPIEVNQLMELTER